MSLERTMLPEDDLLSRFEDELDVAAFGDPAENLSYADRQQLKAGNHAALAREKLPEVERTIWWSKVIGLLGAVLIGGFGILVLLAMLDVFGAGASLGQLGLPFFYVACMGLAAIGRLWKLPDLERRRLLCELVIAAHDEKTPEVA